jgi:capsular exopolysaccharide synthesis family protein
MNPTPLTPAAPGNPRTDSPGGEGEGIYFGDIFRGLSRHPGLILQCTLGCFLAAVLYAFLSPKTYEAVTTIKVPESSESTQNALRQMAFLPSMGDPIETYVQLAQSKTVAERTIQSLRLDLRPEFAGLSKTRLTTLLLNSIQVESLKESDFLNIRARARDPQLAVDLANAWAQNFIQENLDLSRESALARYQFINHQLQEMKGRLDQDKSNKQNYLDPSNEAESDQVVYKMLLEQDQESQIAAQAADPGIVVVDPAEMPEKPIKPQKKLILLLGLLLGLFAGGQAAFWLEKIQDRVRTEEDLHRASGLASLALIPNFRKQGGKRLFSPTERFSPMHLIENPDFDHSVYRESFNLFRTNLTFSQVDQKLQVVSIFSPNPGEGKTLLNADLALSLSHTGKKVLLIDADLRKSSVSILFGISLPPRTGLPMLLAGQGKASQMVMKSGIENLWLLSNNVIPPNPAVLLGSESLKRLIQDLKKDFDYIVLDGAPVLPVADSVLLSALLDGVVLMALYNQTRRADIHLALRLLRAVHAPLLGTIFNGVDMKNDVYGYGHGYAPFPASTDSVTKIKTFLSGFSPH